MKLLKVGDKIQIECMSGLGTGGPAKITKITTQYDINTGKPYKIIWCGTRKFSAKTGNALSKPIMYYIDS